MRGRRREKLSDREKEGGGERWRDRERERVRERDPFDVSKREQTRLQTPFFYTLGK